MSEVSREEFQKRIRAVDSIYDGRLLFGDLGKAGLVVFDRKQFELSLVKERSLRKLWEERPSCMHLHGYDKHQAKWYNKMEQAFDERFPEDKAFELDFERQLEDLQKALDNFPCVTKSSSVQIQKHPSISALRIAIVECSFCGKKEKHEISEDRIEEWEKLGGKKALCKTCALKLGEIFAWYNDLRELFSGFQGLFSDEKTPLKTTEEPTLRKEKQGNDINSTNSS
jgi:hypothetical protein